MNCQTNELNVLSNEKAFKLKFCESSAKRAVSFDCKGRRICCLKGLSGQYTVTSDAVYRRLYQQIWNYQFYGIFFSPLSADSLRLLCIFSFVPVLFLFRGIVPVGTTALRLFSVDVCVTPCAPQLRDYRTNCLRLSVYKWICNY